MGKVYVRADDDVLDLLREVQEEWHGGLTDAGVTVDVLMVSDDAEDDSDAPGPVLKHGGYPAAALIKIQPHIQRALGLGDALLQIDEGTWEGLDVAGRRALLDHELTHLELVYDEDGLARDDCDRPKLKMRLHDYHLGGFIDVHKRHGKAAIETQNAIRSVRLPSGQYVWDFEATASRSPSVNEIAEETTRAARARA